METTATQQTFCFFSWSQIHHLIFSGNICYSVIETEITCDLETTIKTQLIMYNNMFAAGRAPCLFTFLLRFPGDTFKHQHYELWVILLVCKVQLRDWSLVHLNSLSGWNNNSEDLRTFWFHVMDDSKHRDDGQKVWPNKESSHQLIISFSPPAVSVVFKHSERFKNTNSIDYTTVELHLRRPWTQHETWVHVRTESWGTPAALTL